jgi:hypothetical protein
VEIGGFPGEALVQSALSALEHGPRPAEYAGEHQLVFRSRPHFNWQTLAESADEDPLIQEAAWIY